MSPAGKNQGMRLMVPTFRVRETVEQHLLRLIEQAYGPMSLGPSTRLDIRGKDNDAPIQNGGVTFSTPDAPTSRVGSSINDHTDPCRAKTLSAPVGAREGVRAAVDGRVAHGIDLPDSESKHFDRAVCVRRPSVSLLLKAARDNIPRDVGNVRCHHMRFKGNFGLTKGECLFLRRRLPQAAQHTRWATNNTIGYHIPNLRLTPGCPVRFMNRFSRMTSRGKPSLSAVS